MESSPGGGREVRSRGPTLTLTSGGPGPRSLCGRRGGKQQLVASAQGRAERRLAGREPWGTHSRPATVPDLAARSLAPSGSGAERLINSPPGLGETFLFVCGLAGAFGGSPAGSEMEGTVEMHARFLVESCFRGGERS